MRTLRLALIGLLLLATPSSVASAANGPGTGTARIACFYSHTRQADPIVAPGVYPSAHLHDFYANPSTDENSTADTLTAASGNCQREPSLHSAYWTPSLYLDGQPHPAHQLTVYYSAVPRPAGSPLPEPIPPGLKLLAGSAGSTTPPPTWILDWSCFQGNSPHIDHPYDCTNILHNGQPTTVQASIRFPQCWDGAGLEPTAVVYAAKQGRGACPSAYPHRLPKLRVTLETDIQNPLNPDGTLRLSFSSGPFYTLHADAFEASDSTRLNTLLCTDAVTC